MKNSKKINILLIMIICVLSLSACQKNKKLTSQDKSSPAVVQPVDTKTEDLKKLSFEEQILKGIEKQAGIQVLPDKLDVQRKMDGFARGYVSPPHQDDLDYWWFALEADGIWTVVKTGQHGINCSELKEYAFPQDLLPECYDALTGEYMEV